MTQPFTPGDHTHTRTMTPPPGPIDDSFLPLPGNANKVTCPICGTTFAPRDTDGKCPICGEQVVRKGASGGAIPVLSPFMDWLRKGGNWKVVALAALILYQLILFIVLWIHLAQTHAL